MVFPPDRQAPEILKPCKQPFDLPPSPISSELSPILGFRLFPVAAMRGNHFYPSHAHKPLIEAVAVIGFVSDELIRGMFDKTPVDHIIDQGHFVWRSGCHVCGDRITKSVRDCHDFGSFTALCLADSRTPFFAGTKVPSIKASRMSMPPRSYRSAARSWTMRRKTP